MLVHVTNAVKQRIVRYLRSRISEHPDLKDALISNKMPSRDIPNKALIITSSSAGHIRLALDDLIQSNVASRAALARTVEGPSTSIEWVIDNPEVSQGDMVADGFYFTTVLTVPTYSSPGTYSISPVHKIVNTFDEGVSVAPLSQLPLESRMTVYTTFNGEKNRYLVSPHHYVYDSDINEVVLSQPLPQEELVVEYFAAQPDLGPFSFKNNFADASSLPGVVLAFGERIYEGDQQVISISNPSVNPSRVDIYGGQFDVTLDITAYAQDPGMQERLVDYVSVWLWERRRELEDQNIILGEVSISGESTESEIETSTVPYYQASLSISLLTYWEIRVPLLFEWKSLEIYDIKDDDGTLTDAEVAANIDRTTISVLEISQEGPEPFFTPDTRIRLIKPGFQSI